ncbi:MAG: DMT family transporter [Bacteroidales bacterium]|nr:DMT family transporter [Bacteroidales bacterium]MBK8881522.1 DMT family transporter [Bacteroidales bacterium]
MNKTRQSYIYAGLAIFFWSTVPTAFKISLAELDILTMLTIAALTSMLILLIVVLASGKWHLVRQSTAKGLFNSAILGLINPFLYYLILLRAYKLLPAQVAQPLNMIWPILLVFLSVPLLGQKIGGKSFAALFISFAGVYLISSQGNPFHFGGSDITGVFLATGSSIFWAFYFILNVRDERDESVKLFLNFLFGSIYLIAAMILTGNMETVPGLRGILGSVYIGIFEMGITFFFWLKALSMASTTDKVSNLVYFAPFISLIFVHFILNEPVYYTTPVGLLLIIGGILIQNRKTVKI